MSWQRRGGFRVLLDGRTYRLRPLSGVETAAAAAADQWTMLVPDGLVPEDRAALLHRLVDPGDWLDLPHIRALAFLVAEPVLGVPWPVASRLCVVAEKQWVEFHGWCLAHGIDPRQVAVDEVCAVVWGWLSDRMTWADADDRKRLTSEIWAGDDRAAALIEAGIIPADTDAGPVGRLDEVAAWFGGELPELPDLPNPPENDGS